MGDRKPKKTSSGSADKHKAKGAKADANRLAAGPKPDDKKKGKGK